MPHTLLLSPSDVLFFSDGRPMSGSLSGHTDAWPAPHIANTALHAALHRAEIEGTHAHTAGRSSQRDYTAERARKFGSLLTAGPFPVAPDGTWYFPAPADLAMCLPDVNTPATEGGAQHGDAQVAFAPHRIALGTSSLPAPLTHAVAATMPPAKDASPGNWLRDDAWDAYLKGKHIPAAQHARVFRRDADIADIEHATGIGIAADTGTQDGKSFYTAHYLRLREGWRLGIHAEALDKISSSTPDANGNYPRFDLIATLFASERHIVIGGQQRLCTVERAPYIGKIPRGLDKADDFPRADDGKHHVKWVLLAPAIFPAIPANTPAITAHPGGWLPSWIDAQTGTVHLKGGDTERRPNEPRDAWRARVRNSSAPIAARLVAALTGKPVAVTGWASGEHAGAKPVQFAVPAGSIYYFTCDTAADAVQLAAALNWHGALAATADAPPAIRNRRSVLLGEKGYGLGICGTW